MIRRLAYALLLLLVLSAGYGWTRWSRMPDFAWGCDLFGHLNHSKQIRKAWSEGRAPDLVFESPQTRDLIDFMKSSGHSVDEWLYLVGPHAHHYIPRADHVANQYSPATGLLLALFPDRSSVSGLIRFTLIALLAFGVVAITRRGLLPSLPDQAQGAVLKAIAATFAVFQGIQLLNRSELNNPSMYAIVLPTFLASFFCARSWSQANHGKESRWSSLASGVAAGIAIFVRLPGVFQLPGYLLLLKRRDWFWFLTGAYFFGVLPQIFYQAYAAGAWWATTYGPLDTGAPSLKAIPHYIRFYLIKGGGAPYFAVPLVTFAAYFLLKGWKRWNELGRAALVIWALPAAYFLTHVPAVSYYMNPAHLAAVGLLCWGVFFEYSGKALGFTVGREAVIETLTDWKKVLRLFPLLALFTIAMPWAWAFASFSKIALDPPMDSSLFRVVKMPSELLGKNSWIWSDVSNGAFWYYADKPAFNIAFGGSPELRRKVFDWVESRGGYQFLIMDGGGSQIVAREIVALKGRLDYRGEVFGQKYYRIYLPRERTESTPTVSTPGGKTKSGERSNRR